MDRALEQFLCRELVVAKTLKFGEFFKSEVDFGGRAVVLSVL